MNEYAADSPVQNAGAVYHDTFNPTKIDGICDECGSAEMKRRDDDNETTVNQRLNAYHEQTSPLAEWYDSRGIFHRINGDRDIDEITSDILKSLS